MPEAPHAVQPVRWAALLVFVFALVLYLTSAPADLTWANDSADGGDLISAAAVHGIPHPPGYPLWMLLAQALSRLLLATPAWRATLISMISAATAAALTTAMVAWLSRSATPAAWRAPALLPAVAAGVLAAAAPALWGQAVVVEVYALHAALSAALLAILLRWQHSLRPAWGITAGLLFGLGLANHLTTVWLLPAVAAAWWGQPAAPRSRSMHFAAGLLIGLSPYFYLPWAAAGHPPINWAAADPRGWLWLVSGELYRGYVFATPWAEWPLRLSAWAAALWRNLLPWGLAAAVWGLLSWARAQPRMTAAWLTSLLLGLVWAMGYNTSDSLLSWMPGWVMLAVAAGVGYQHAISTLARQPRAAHALAAAGLLLALLPVTWRWPAQNLRHDRAAEQFYHTVLAQAQSDAVLITAGDRATFALWYGHYALHLRPDVVLVSRDLWSLPDYRATLISHHPALAPWRTAPWDELARGLAADHPVYLVEAGLSAPPGWILTPYP